MHAQIQIPTEKNFNKVHLPTTIYTQIHSAIQDFEFTQLTI